MKQGQLENKGSWHQNSLPALHAPCCYASIYQAALLLFRLHTAHTHAIQIRSWGVQDVEGCSGDMGDLFNRCWTLWAGCESISGNWCDRPFLEACPMLFRSTTRLMWCMHITFVHLCAAIVLPVFLWFCSFSAVAAYCRCVWLVSSQTSGNAFFISISFVKHKIRDMKCSAWAWSVFLCLSLSYITKIKSLVKTRRRLFCTDAHKFRCCTACG